MTLTHLKCLSLSLGIVALLFFGLFIDTYWQGSKSNKEAVLSNKEATLSLINSYVERAEGHLVSFDRLSFLEKSYSTKAVRLLKCIELLSASMSYNNAAQHAVDLDTLREYSELAKKESDKAHNLCPEYAKKYKKIETPKIS